MKYDGLFSITIRRRMVVGHRVNGSREFDETDTEFYRRKNIFAVDTLCPAGVAGIIFADHVRRC